MFTLHYIFIDWFLGCVKLYRRDMSFSYGRFKFVYR